MAWIYTKFGATYSGGVDLPLLDGTEPAGAGPVPDSLAQLPGGGAFDTQGGKTTTPESRVITLKGYWVETSYAAMDTKVDALSALVGVRSYLWRSNDGGTTKRWRLARCKDVRVPTAADSGLYAPIEMDFELLPGVWNGAAHTETTVLDTTPHAITTTNGGNARVRDAILRLETTTANTITSIGVSISGKVDWHWTGSLEAGIGIYLIINCGTRSVTYMGNDAYSGFALQAGHADNDWLPLDPGANTISVHFTGSAEASAYLTYYDGRM